jgi:signal transduction histidine kinase
MNAASPLPLDEPVIELESALERVLPLLPGAIPLSEDVESARERVAAIVGAAESDPEATSVAVLAVLGDLVASLAVEHPWAEDDLASLVEETAEATGVPQDLAATTIYLRAARDPRLLELSPPLAVAAQLRLFVALAPVTGVSLWTVSSFDRARCVFHFGDTTPTRRMRLVARSTLGLEDAEDEPSRGHLLGIPVPRWQRPYAALVVRPRRDARELASTLGKEAAAVLAPVLEREALLERNSARERSLVEASERRLARLGFDLHDGPMQDIVALAGDVRLLGHALRSAMPVGGAELGLRLDGLEARLGHVDGQLRELAQSLEPSSLIMGPLPALLEREIDSFRIQTEIAIELHVTGELDGLTASQRIALIRIVQEALSNVREHSGAGHVSVSVGVRRNHVYAEIEDDGRGFDVERTLVRSARRGRLGLVGMGERTRLLGGRFDVVSRSGGPTLVSVAFPPWRPLSVEKDLLAAATSERSS